MESQQLSLFEIENDTLNVSIANNAIEQKIIAIQKYLGHIAKDNDCYINTYYPGKRDTIYFRLSYRQGCKMKHHHIPGGNINSDLAQYRVKRLQEMIDRGAELGEVLAALSTYRGGMK